MKRESHVSADARVEARVDTRPVPIRPAKSSLTLASLLKVGLLTVAIVLLSVAAAWPIYQTARLWAVAGIAGLGTLLIMLAATRWRFGALTVAAVAGLFVIAVVPLAVPLSGSQPLAAGGAEILSSLGDGLAAVALGWKQLLTLTLPVGSYQAVLVPFLVVVMLSVAFGAWLTLRGGRAAPFAAALLLAPVLFGTSFGSSAVSPTAAIGPLTVPAPLETGLWIIAFGLAGVWVWWTSGVERRAALKRGRLSAAEPSDASSGGASALRRAALSRGLVAGITLVAALFIGVVAAPLVTTEDRTVPRDNIDPEIVVRDSTSLLAGYRTWKRDAPLAATMFTATADGELPGRLRIAVLDTYNGVDFTVGSPSGVGRFTRFPSGEPVQNSSRVRVEIGSSYSDIWVPFAMPLGSPPAFAGERAGDLADSFYVNRELGAAIAVPTAKGLRSGDAYVAEMAVAPDVTVDAEPAHADAQIDLEAMPELATWLQAQSLPATGDGLQEAITRLRDRGYLSHSLTDGEGERDWSLSLAEETGLQFFSSTGGHSLTRVEQLFRELNEQEQAAGEKPDDEMLVAAIGDDEQFAAAAALVARALGYDSRIVVGVRLGDEDAGVPGVPACAEACTGEHLAAWVEVRGAGNTWAPLDVSPQIANPPASLEKGEQLPEYPTLPEEQDATESDPPVGTSDQDATDNEDTDDATLGALGPILRIIGLSLAALLLALLPFLFVPVAKRMRRKRRRAETVPELHALGAWHDLLDAYRDSSFYGAGSGAAGAAGAAGGASAPQGAGRLATLQALRVDTAEWIASTVDEAVFAREGISAEQSTRLREVVDEMLVARSQELGAWGRMRARYSLKSLGVGRRSESRRARRASTTGGAT